MFSSAAAKKMSLMNVYAAVCMHVCRSRLRMDGRRMEREGERARYPKREEKEEEEEEDQGEETITNNSIYIYIYQPTRHFTPINTINQHHLFPKNNLYKSNIPPLQKTKPPQKMQFFALLATAALAAAAPSVLETRGGEKVCASGAPYCCQLDVLGVAAVSCSDGKYLTSYLVVKSNELSETLTIFFFFLSNQSPEAPSPSTNSIRSASTRD